MSNDDFDLSPKSARQVAMSHPGGTVAQLNTKTRAMVRFNQSYQRQNHYDWLQEKQSLLLRFLFLDLVRCLT